MVVTDGHASRIASSFAMSAFDVPADAHTYGAVFGFSAAKAFHSSTV